MTGVAADVRAGQPEILAEEVDRAECAGSTACVYSFPFTVIVTVTMSGQPWCPPFAASSLHHPASSRAFAARDVRRCLPIVA